VSARHWIKAGVEYADVRPQLGAVVTTGLSDWSLAPVPTWRDRRILIRVSRSGDALTIRSAVDAGEIQLVRIVPFPPGLVAHAGPYICAPTRAGLTIPFRAWSAVPAPPIPVHSPAEATDDVRNNPDSTTPEKRQGAPAPQACPPGTGTGQNIYAWVAAEAGTVKRLRRYLVNEGALIPDNPSSGPTGV
jgi:hypothetical protein